MELRKQSFGTLLDKSAAEIVLIDSDDVVLKMVQSSRLRAIDAKGWANDNNLALKENLKLLKNTWLFRVKPDVDSMLWVEHIDLARYVSRVHLPLYMQKCYELGTPCSRCWLRGGNRHCNPIVLCNLVMLLETADFLKTCRIISVMAYNHLLCDIDIAAFSDIAGEITSISKRLGNEFDAQWMDLCNFEQLLGFNVGDDILEDEDRIRGWGDGETRVGLDDPEFDTMLLDSMKKRCVTRPLLSTNRLIGFKQFVSSPGLWLTTGSGTRKAEKVDVETKLGTVSGKVKKNRTWWAMGKSAEDIVSEFFESPVNKFILKPAIKVELGRKSRDIISAGELLQVGMAYIFYLVEPLFRGSTFTPIFMDSRQQSEMWINFMSKVSSRKGATFPYDTASFDQTVGTNEIRVFFKWMRSVLLDRIPSEGTDWPAVMDRIEEVFFEQPVILGGRVIFIWKHGVPSGIRWTALMDTVINLGRQQLVSEVLSSLFGSAVSVDMVAQGDDIALFTRSGFTCLLWFNLVNFLGYTAHPKKNWIGLGRGREIEFLRKVVSRESIKGYIIRRLGGSMFRDPTKPANLTVEEKINERFSGMSVLAQRGCNVKKCYNVLFKSMYSVFINKVHEHTLKSWFHTPKSFGGFGLHPISISGHWVRLNVLDKAVINPRVAPTGVMLENKELQIARFPILELGSGAYDEQVAQRLGFVDTAGYNFQFENIVRPPLTRFSESDAGLAAKVWWTWTPRSGVDPVMARSAATLVVKSGLGQSNLVLLRQLCSDETFGVISLVWRKWAKALMLAWIEDSLPNHVPRRLGSDDQVLALVANWYANMTRDRVLKHHRVSLLDFERYCFDVERMTLRAFSHGNPLIKSRRM